VDSDGGNAAIRIERSRHGIPEVQELSIRFFESPEYAQLADLGQSLVGLIGEGACVTRGSERREVQSFRQAMDWLMDEARKGQSIQRYKGLGEMNPEQLWETTVNPQSRRLMQVRIEDAVAADEIFTTLMGDQVEPRRDFIERNALAVENLDV
jgi:DNA gyrase subunit B